MEQKVRELLDKVIESAGDRINVRFEAEAHIDKIQDQLSHAKDKNLINNYGITDSYVYSYHNYKLVYENKRWYMLTFVIGLDNEPRVRDKMLVRKQWFPQL